MSWRQWQPRAEAEQECWAAKTKSHGWQRKSQKSEAEGQTVACTVMPQHLRLEEALHHANRQGEPQEHKCLQSRNCYLVSIYHKLKPGSAGRHRGCWHFHTHTQKKDHTSGQLFLGYRQIWESLNDIISLVGENDSTSPPCQKASDEIMHTKRLEVSMCRRGEVLSTHTAIVITMVMLPTKTPPPSSQYLRMKSGIGEERWRSHSVDQAHLTVSFTSLPPTCIWSRACLRLEMEWQTDWNSTVTSQSPQAVLGYHADTGFCDLSEPII